MRAILALSVPAIVTNITTPVLGITDVAIAGHLGSTVFIAAIAIGSNMFNLLYWMFGFLRMGSSGLTAQAYGASDCKGYSLVLWRAMLIALCIGCVMIIFRHPLCRLMLYCMDVSGETYSVSQSYFEICIWGSPAVLGTFALTGWFVGMQNSRITMCVSLIIDIVNILLSLTFVFAAGMKLNGLATGTLCAQWVGFAIGLFLCLRKYHPIVPAWKEIVEWSGLKRFFSVNIDIFLRTLCLVTVTMWFTRAGAAQGDTMLAVNALLMQMFTIFSFFMDGFAFSGEALCGRFKGAGDYLRFRRTVSLLLISGGCLAMVFTALYTFFGSEFINLLTDDLTVVSGAKDYFWWAVSIPAVGFMAFTWDGIFIGATETRSMLASMALATFMFFLVYFAAYPSLSNHGLWLAFISYLAVRGIALAVMARKYYRPDYFCSAR